MKKALVTLAALAALAAPAAALAHPLGNFTVNCYSRIEPSGGRVYVLYVLDMAEIPAFQERQGIKDEGVYSAALARRIGRRLELTAGGRRLALTPLRHVLAFPPGAAGLRTLRFEATYRSEALAPGRSVALRFRDTNYRDRIGWKEVVVRADDGARVSSSSVPAQSISEELLSYPKDLLRSPLEVTAASTTVVPGSGPGVAPTLLSRDALQARVSIRRTTETGFASLIAKDHLSTGFVLLSLLIALFWGAAHAFSPGHGKAIVAGYLIGSRGNARHAVLLGLIVTVTHTIGVFALGLVTLALSQFIVPEQLYPWLNLVSALLVVAVGIAIVRWRARSWLHERAHAREQHHHHDHGHHHGHEHTHDHGHEHGHGGHGHSHVPAPGSGMRGLVGVGISGGILPCPTALVVLLAAISLHRVGYGLILIVAFSVGLAASVTGIGLVAVTAKRAFGRMSFDGRLVRLLPAVSALVVLILGIAMTIRALPSIV